jgi:hypothetical protein
VVQEAGLEDVGSGLAPVTGGWFVVNVRDAAWLTNDAFGARCVFEADTPVLRRRPDLSVQRFAEIGITVHALGTAHGFIGAGSGPCVILMTGGRTRAKDTVYPRSDEARRHGAGVETETHSPSEAYAPFPHWQPERPASWDGLPWA